MFKNDKVKKQSFPFTPFINPSMLSTWMEQMTTTSTTPPNSATSSEYPNPSQSSYDSHVQKESTSLPKKRKKGRSSVAARRGISKNAAYSKKIIDSYPNIKITDSIALMQIDECAKCHIYIGRFALSPCGHAKYCMKCINELRSKSIKTNIPGRCLSNTCLSIVKSWFVLYKV